MSRYKFIRTSMSSLRCSLGIHFKYNGKLFTQQLLPTPTTSIGVFLQLFRVNLVGSFFLFGVIKNLRLQCRGQK